MTIEASKTSSQINIAEVDLPSWLPASVVKGERDGDAWWKEKGRNLTRQQPLITEEIIGLHTQVAEGMLSLSTQDFAKAVTTIQDVISGNNS